MPLFARDPWHTFVWRIEACTPTISLLDQFLRSPLFTFRNTKWLLLLEKRDSDSLYVVLRRSKRCLSDQDIIYINMRLYIVDNNNDKYPLRVLSNFGFAKNARVEGYLSWKRLQEDRRVLLFNDILTFRCDMTISVCSTFKITSDILRLSSDILSMQEKRIFCDSEIKVGDKLFSFHKGILWARCLSFAKHLEVSEESLRKDIMESFDDDKNFELLLRYLYCGKVNGLTNEMAGYLQMASYRYKLDDLVAKISVHLNKCTGRSRLDNERIYVTWPIPDLMTMRVFGKVDSAPLRCPRYRCSLVFRILKRSNLIHLFCRKVAVRPNNTQDTILVGVILNIPGETDNSDCFKVVFHPTDKHWKMIETNETFKNWIREKISTRCESVILHLQIFLSRNYIASETEKFLYSSECPPTSVECMQGLARDLRLLYGSEKYSDVSLTSKEYQVEAHKAVLCARSPVFAKKFEQHLKCSSLKIIKMTDMEPETLERLMLYIYAAEINLPSLHICKELYIVAHDYQVLGLREQCSEYLKAFVWLTDFCDILILADRYNDRKLKATVHRVIYTSLGRRFQNPAWKQFIWKETYLAAEVILIVAIPLLIILASEFYLSTREKPDNF